MSGNSNNGQDLADLWRNNFRPGLHDLKNWNEDGKVELIFSGSGMGFSGGEKMRGFFKQHPKSIFGDQDAAIEEIFLNVNEADGAICDEFVLSWTQKNPKMEWLLPGHLISLQRVRVYWDQLSFLHQSGTLRDSFRCLVRAGASGALETAIESLPGGEVNGNTWRVYLNPALIADVASSSQKSAPGLNTLDSLLSDLPNPKELAVLTPQLPARSRSINPALLSTMRFGEDLPFDSPAPANSRAVRNRSVALESASDVLHAEAPSRSILDPEAPAAPYQRSMGLGATKKLSGSSGSLFMDPDAPAAPYQPLLQSNSTQSRQLQSNIFDDMNSTTSAANTQMNSNFVRTCFESRAFTGNSQAAVDYDNDNEVSRHQVSVGPPSTSNQSRFLSPEEDLSLTALEGLEKPSKTLQRPQMRSHFSGSQIGHQTSAESSRSRNDDDELLHYSSPSFQPILGNSQKFDPNRGQMKSLSGLDDDEAEGFKFSLRPGAAISSGTETNDQNARNRPVFNPNIQSQIAFDFDSPSSNSNNPRPSSRVTEPPGVNVFNHNDGHG